PGGMPEDANTGSRWPEHGSGTPPGCNHFARRTGGLRFAATSGYRLTTLRVAGTRLRRWQEVVKWLSSPAQNTFLIPLHFREPLVSDWNAFGLAIKIPDRAERERFDFLLQRQARGVVVFGFRRAQTCGRLEQRDEQRAQHI